jgi:membrane-bound lytic murein transglycosylase MltF
MRGNSFYSIVFILACVLPTQTTAMATEQKAAPEKLSMELIDRKWTGDFNGMVKRRLIRVLTVYSKTFYFIDKGTPRGIVYDAMKAFDDEINTKLKTGNLRVQIVYIPVSRDELLPKLEQGLGDIAMANLTVTPERLKTVEFTDPLLRNVNEIVVTGTRSPKISTLDDLSGQEIFVRKSSSYYQSILKLNEEFKKKGKAAIVIKPAPENLENEDLLEMLNAGLIKILIMDRHIAEFWKQVFPDITVHSDVVVYPGGDIAWAVRKNSPEFLAQLNAFIKTHGKGTTFGNMMFQKYLKSVKYVKNATSQAEIAKFNNIRELFKKYGAEYGVDGVLMAAQGYQESRLDQSVKSQVGAIGVMQVMPATAKDLKVGDVTQVEANIHAGVKYMRFMIEQYYKNEPMDDLNKMLFAFASYNAGPARIRGLRKEAAARGLNPNVWFGNVERIASEEIGRETVTYVSNIYKYYIAYTLILEEIAEKNKAKEQIKN